MEEFEAKLKAGEFVTIEQARRCLPEEHGIETDYQRVWYWAKKLNGVLKVPRPSQCPHHRLAPYSPEHNPGEQLWDLIKDDLVKRVFKSVEDLRTSMLPILESCWMFPQRVISLIERPCLHTQVNTSYKNYVSANYF